MSHHTSPPFVRAASAFISLCWLAAAPLPLSASAALAERESPESREARVSAAVQRFMATAGAPSTSVAIARNGAVTFRDAWGLADLENFVPAKPETVYRTASVAKPMTAVAILQLVDQGRIDLDAPVQRYVAAFPSRYGGVTIRDLLRHTGGIRHYRGDEFASTRHCSELSEALAIFADDALENEPGELITYSSYGYVLLGLAVEGATGSRFDEYMRTHVFEAARMRRTRGDDIRAVIHNRAAGYTGDGAGGIRNADLVDTSCRVPAGGLVASAEDLARFGAALLGGRLLKPELVAQMMQSQLSDELVRRTLRHMKAPPDARPPGLGLGWAIGTEKHPEAVLHGGNQQGTTSMIYLLPAEQIVVAILTNIEGKGAEITELAENLAELARE